MNDLHFTPAGRSRRRQDISVALDWVNVVHQPPRTAGGDRLVRVSLERFLPRVSLAEGARFGVVGGSVCRDANAPAVIESFLFQIADPGDDAPTG